jgi:hypothetical protein
VRIRYALRLVAVLGCVLGSVALAADVIFGPQTFNGTGRPLLLTRAFTIAATLATYTLRVTNHGVALEFVLLNGRIVVGPADLHASGATPAPKMRA